MARSNIHIVVQDGLIQEVYLEKPLDADVVIHDLDTDVPDELVQIKKSVDSLRTGSLPVYKVY